MTVSMVSARHGMQLWQPLSSLREFASSLLRLGKGGGDGNTGKATNDGWRQIGLPETDDI